MQNLIVIRLLRLFVPMIREKCRRRYVQRKGYPDPLSKMQVPCMLISI